MSAPESKSVVKRARELAGKLHLMFALDSAAGHNDVSFIMDALRQERRLALEEAIDALMVRARSADEEMMHWDSRGDRELARSCAHLANVIKRQADTIARLRDAQDEDPNADT